MRAPGIYTIFKFSILCTVELFWDIVKNLLGIFIEAVPGQRVVEGVEEERIVAMSASDPAHARHLRVDTLVHLTGRSLFACGTETGAGGEGARLMILLQFGLNGGNIVIDQTLNSKVLPGTGNSLRASLADEQAVAGTSHIS